MPPSRSELIPETKSSLPSPFRSPTANGEYPHPVPHERFTFSVKCPVPSPNRTCIFCCSDRNEIELAVSVQVSNRQRGIPAPCAARKIYLFSKMSRAVAQ